MNFSTKSVDANVRIDDVPNNADGEKIFVEKPHKPIPTIIPENIVGSTVVMRYDRTLSWVMSLT